MWWRTCYTARELPRSALRHSDVTRAIDRLAAVACKRLSGASSVERRKYVGICDVMLSCWWCRDVTSYVIGGCRLTAVADEYLCHLASETWWRWTRHEAVCAADCITYTASVCCVNIFGENIENCSTESVIMSKVRDVHHWHVIKRARFKR